MNFLSSHFSFFVFSFFSFWGFYPQNLKHVGGGWRGGDKAEVGWGRQQVMVVVCVCDGGEVVGQQQTGLREVAAP
jgi:hypothetical protein